MRGAVVTGRRMKAREGLKTWRLPYRVLQFEVTARLKPRCRLAACRSLRAPLSLLPVNLPRLFGCRLCFAR